MTLSEKFSYFKGLIQDYKRRETCLDLALKCQNDIEKISFIEDDFDRGMTGDMEDDGWWEMKYSFFEQYDLDEDDYEFVCNNIESLCWGKEIICKDEYDEERNAFLKKAILKYKNIFPDGEEILKKFKLNIYSLYFEENVYKFEMQFLRELINEEKKLLRLKYSEDEIPKLEDL